MAIPNYLAKIKSSGVYRYVFDKSEVPSSERTSMRLVVGYSEHGPFNTPVYIEDAQDFINTFGNISRRLERKGVFFHRLALQALSAGPILALNIKPFKNETTKMVSFNASDTLCRGKIQIEAKVNAVELYKVKSDTGEKETPEVLRYFTSPEPDYALVGGKMQFVGSLSTDAKFVRLIEKGTETFWSSADVEGAKIVQGKTVKAHFPLTHCFFNGKYHKIENNKIEIEGAQTDLQDKICASALIAMDGTTTAGEKLHTIYDTNRFWKVTDSPMDITPMETDKAKKDYLRIVQTSSREDSVTIFARPVVPAGYQVKISDWFAQETVQEMPHYLQALRDHFVSEFFMEIYVFKGDFRNAKLFTEEGGFGTYVKKVGEDAKFYPFCKVTDKAGTGAPNMTTGDVSVRTNPDYKDPMGNSGDALAAMAENPAAHFVGRYQGILFPNFLDPNGRSISLDSAFNAGYAAHKCIMGMNESILDDIYEADINGNEIYDTGTEQAPYQIGGLPTTGIADLVRAFTSGVKVENGNIVAQPSCSSIIGYFLEGFTYSTISRSETGRSMVEDKIYSVLGYKGMYEALTNNADIDYKYWVDTFQGFAGVAMKATIASIIKKKFNALGILNFPPMNECMSYVGFPGLRGGFDMTQVTRAGSGITLPVEVQGASWVAYYTQVQMTDGVNKFTVPSGALVSNLFMEKWSTRQPYYIVAGPNNGRINYPNVVGSDYPYSQADLDALEPFGVNAIVYIPRKGLVINSNQTAKQTPVTALSKVHIRELVTYLQDTVEDMLRGYQWELNTSVLRDAIRAKCEVYCDLIKANGGLYEYKVQCDDKNNPPEIIDNEMVVVDIEIEPARGAGKMVQTLTIHRTGGISK